MKKVLTVLCVAALMACMTGCGCGTMVDDGGTSVESTNTTETTEEYTTRPTNDNHGGTSSHYDDTTYDETYDNGTTEHYDDETTRHDGTTEHYYDSTEHSDGVLEDIGEDIEQGVDDIVGTTEHSTEETNTRTIR